ncbi:MAG: hypothetical protein QOJ78_478, partial [Pseudonocardiales bacterium]|nr:hypothetical protein [Pseudonocardiales bacterium]
EPVPTGTDTGEPDLSDPREFSAV